MTSSTLSVLVPLLVRGLKERTTLDKRRTVVVIENMSKLVKDAVDAAPFIPQLLPGKPFGHQEACLHDLWLRCCKIRIWLSVQQCTLYSTYRLVDRFRKSRSCIRQLVIEDRCTISEIPLEPTPRPEYAALIVALFFQLGLEKVSNEVADPECRERAGVAYQVLFNIDKEAKAILNDPENQGHKGDATSITTLLKVSLDHYL